MRCLYKITTTVPVIPFSIIRIDTECGVTTRQQQQNQPFQSDVELESFLVMPNHIHEMVILEDKISGGIEKLVVYL